MTETYIAELSSHEPTITIQHDGEDADLLIIDGQVHPAIIRHEESEEWESDVYDAALAAAGWERVDDWAIDLGVYAARVRRVGSNGAN